MCRHSRTSAAEAVRESQETPTWDVDALFQGLNRTLCRFPLTHERVTRAQS
jgi:hypothetical protein